MANMPADPIPNEWLTVAFFSRCHLLVMTAGLSEVMNGTSVLFLNRQNFRSSIKRMLFVKVWQAFCTASLIVS